MTPSNWFPLPALVVLLTVATSAFAQRLPQVTESALRARLTAYLPPEEPRSLRLPEVRGGGELRLDPRGVTYRLEAGPNDPVVAVRAEVADLSYERSAEGTPQRLVWRYRVGSALRPEQEKKVAEVLAFILDEALGFTTSELFPQPLLTPAQLETLRKVYVFERLPDQGSVGTTHRLPLPPMPMAGRLFPVYPLYPTGGPVVIAYAGETFHSADRIGYWLYAAPAYIWSVSPPGWIAVPHPEVVAPPFPNRLALLTSGLDVTVLRADGCAAYWAGDYRRAREYLEAAVRRNGRDAAAWQFLALTYWALGEEPAGQRAARYGAAVAVAYPEENAELPFALEKVQGAARRRLNAVTASVATPAEALAVLRR